MKIIVAPVTAIATLGTLALAPAAQADPYPRSIETQCSATVADSRIRPDQDARVRFTWTAEGNASPGGPVDWVVRRNGRVYDRGSFNSGGGTRSFRFQFSKGNYRVIFQTDTPRTSVFRNCSDSTPTIKVRNRF